MLDSPTAAPTTATPTPERTAAPKGDLAAELAESRRREAELAAEVDLLRRLLDGSLDGVLAFDRDLRFTVWNPAMERLSRVPRGRAVGATVGEVFPGLLESGEERYFRAALAGETLWRRDRPYRSSGGVEGWYDAVYGPLRDAEGEVVGGLTIVHDVTERKQLEDERLRASKLESLSVLAGGIAHDFNNILTGILGNNALAKILVEPRGEVHQALEATERAVFRATSLTSQLLTFARGGAPVKETASMAELVRESATFAVRGSNVRCELHLAAALSPAEIDPAQINQVIANVVLNACQAMPNGGVIRVYAQDVEIERDTKLPLQRGRYIKLAIRDEGVGIPEHLLEKIFDPYYTTKAGGSGLGLATAYSIVKKHRGCMTVGSLVDIGSTFTIYLPAAVRAAAPAPEDSERSHLGTAKVLVMDDDAMIRSVLGRALTRFGYEAVFARDGEEAVALFEAAAARHPFEAVVLDLTVPGGMGGKDALVALRRRDPAIRAIVASGYSDDPIMADFAEHGFDGRITKPYRPQDLGRKLNEVLEKERPSEPAGERG